MKVVVIDSETTDTVDPELVEFAAIVFGEDPCDLLAISEYDERFRPTKPISLGALSVHHIMDEDLVDCRPSTAFKFPGDVDYIVGHNVDFDWRVVGEPDVKRICTLALCRSIWPEIDSHTQSAMLYHLERGTAREMLKDAHSAKADVIVCVSILKHIIKHTQDQTWNDLWESSEVARVPKIMPFGKHKGVPMVDVPQGYKKWLMRQSDVDPYLMQALTK